MKQKAIRISPWAPPDLSFAEIVAFPYNRHLLHDVGAFQIGIGTTMLLALMWTDGVMVVLAGYVVGTGFHLVSHILDRHIGGHSYDPLVLSVMGAVGLAGMYVRSRVSGRTPRGGRAVRTLIPREGRSLSRAVSRAAAERERMIR